MPAADYLHLAHKWLQENARASELAWKFLGENDELLNLLYTNLASVQFNRHNLEVYLSIAQLCRQNLLMFKRLEEVSNNLDKAEEHAGKLHYAEAVAALDQALDVAGKSATNATRRCTTSRRPGMRRGFRESAKPTGDTWRARRRILSTRKAPKAPGAARKAWSTSSSGNSRCHSAIGSNQVQRREEPICRGAQVARARRQVRLAGHHDPAQPAGQSRVVSAEQC